jgi:hypothetical protein
MIPIEFRKRLVGGLDKDTNLNEVKPIDFIDGYDVVDRMPRLNNQNGLLQPCSNTNLAYDLQDEAVEVVTKKYRVLMNFTGLASCDLLFNIELQGFYSGNITVPYTSGDNGTVAYAAIQAAFVANTELTGTIFTLGYINGFELLFDIEIVYYQYSNYILKVSNDLGDVYNCECLIDAISNDFLGTISPICFANINNDQQVFATTNKTKPQELSATLAAASRDYIYISFVDDPLIIGEVEVYIYPTAGGSSIVSGICTISNAGFPNLYEITGSKNPFAATATIPSTVYTVVRYYRTLSLIGYAQKNDIIDAWDYTELLRSTNLNFRPYKQIQGALDITEDGIIYDWTDFLNPLRRLIYRGQIIANGFLTLYNTEAIYDLDSIELESRLQLGVNTSKVSLAVATVTGSTGYTFGAKSTACYAAFIRFKTNDGAYSTYSKASNVLWLRNSEFEHSYGVNSGKAIQITIEQIPLGIYDFVQVGIIEFTTDSWKGYSLPEIQINGEETIYVADSGLNTESYIDFNAAGDLLEEIPFVFENAKSILAYNNYRLAANANLYQQYDLTDWAQSIELTVAKNAVLVESESALINPSEINSNIFAGINDYSKCSNEWMSYMPYDHYRFCVFIDWENGMPTSTYWIDDVSFDPADTGFTDEALFYSAGDFYYNQLHVEAKLINLNYGLPDGKTLKEVVKDIRFGRALCNAQVYTTGFANDVLYDGGSGLDIVQPPPSVSYNAIGFKLALYSPDLQNTSLTFNFSTGDLLKLRLCENDSLDLYDTANQAQTFTQKLIDPTTETVSVFSLVNAPTGSLNDIAAFRFGGISMRGGAAVETTPNFTPATPPLENCGRFFFYIKPYGLDGAYPSRPQQTRFFVLPQNQWFNKTTHNSSTVYKIYGGDAFPTLSAYKLSERSVPDTLSYNTVIFFWNYNRTNTGLRSGSFPYVSLDTYLKNKFLTESYFTIYPFDRYFYDAVFTPRYIFQNSVAFNPLLPQFTNQFSTLYYSNQSFSSNVSGGNRTWLPLDNKVLETKYGAITHIETLLGQTGTNILIVWQERRVTAQYFDNTANIKSNTGELLIGNGAVLGRDGQNFTEFGCEHKWSIVKGQTDTGKDVAYWLCLRKTAIMRFGADGTSNIIGNIASLIENRGILGLFNGYNNDDEPALFNGCHAVWDNKRMEYIVTLRLLPKIKDARTHSTGEFAADPVLKWGFEQFPVIYLSLIDGNTSTPPSRDWLTIDSYDSEYITILTLVWSEMNNTFKTFRTYSPKIYGQFNDNYVSSHPTQGNLIYEHNDINNEALFYCVKETTEITATTDPATFRINGTGIESTFPSPFVVGDRQKYVVAINGKNYEVVGTGTNFLQMANVDSDDVLPQATIFDFSYSVCNSQDPYITGLCNNPEAKYFHFEQKSVQADDALKRTEYEAGYNGTGTTLTKGFSVKSEEVYQNGTWDTQIRQDTTSNPTNNTVGRNKVEGVWMKFKNIFRWGKNNKVLITIIKALETQKTK